VKDGQPKAVLSGRAPYSNFLGFGRLLSRRCGLRDEASLSFNQKPDFLLKKVSRKEISNKNSTSSAQAKDKGYDFTQKKAATGSEVTILTARK